MCRQLRVEALEAGRLISQNNSELSMSRGTLSSDNGHDFRQNDILRALDVSVFDRLAPKLQWAPLELGKVLYQADDEIGHVHFPTSGIISLLAVFEDGNTVEAGLIGSEGMLGTSVLAGVNNMPHQALVQADGRALRITAADFQTFLKTDGQLRDLALRYGNAFFTQVAQTAGCNRIHSLEKRLARWLLLTHDRIEGDHFNLTQDFISRMLGVRRAGVSVAASTLRQMQAIDYERGNIRVRDRKSLERASCECYSVVKTAYDRTLNSAL